MMFISFCVPCFPLAWVALNGGQNRDLIKVEGTVATFYRGTQYNTPVEVRIRRPRVHPG